MIKKPTVVHNQIIADTNVFSIERVSLRFANGAEVDYERLRSRGGGAVMIIPLLDMDTVLLIREYAAGVDRYELGFPKGLMEEDESTKSAADREIKEEIGYGSRRLTVLKTLSVAPGYANFETHIVLAEDLYPKRIPGDEPEPIEVVPWKIDDFASLLEQQDFLEARSIAALYLLQHHLDDRCSPKKTL
jgi:ADP-ribose diphosphatase